MNKQFLLRIPLNAVSVYITVLITWFVYFFIIEGRVDPEGAGFVEAIYAPIITLLTLIIIYALSILDSLVLRPAFIVLTTLVGELITLVTHTSDLIVDEKYTFFVHLGVLLIAFVLLTLYKKLRESSGK